MKKSLELANITQAVKQAREILYHSNNKLLALDDNEGSLMGHGILRKLQNYGDYIMQQAELALIEEQKEDKEE